MLRAAVVILALVLAGCSGALLPAPPPPPDLYRLSPAAVVPWSGPRIAAQVLVGEVSAPGALDTDRIALGPRATHVEYFAKAEWTDRAPALVQGLLLDTLDRSGRFARVAQRTLALRADYLLFGALRHFEADYRAGTPPQIRVAVDLQLLRMPGGDIVAQRRFAATVPASQNSVPAVVDAFDAAAHRALQDVPAWVASVLPRSAAKQP
ncbi:MAG: membrane integrity-associated transporter subunit PqiC [Alphaproteobacteria bacterium]|nr:membrane integrity-associated transporter subunit PqiC [Alphaproteobacteria bacterium]